MPEELSDASPELVASIKGGMTHKIRDVFKCLRDKVGVNLAFFGLENQTKVEKTMPIRVMTYDALSYTHQLECVKSPQKPIPVVTFVLYFGYDKRWSAPHALRECFEIPEDLEPWFADYPIHIVELAWLSDDVIDALNDDLKTIAQGLRCFRHRDFDAMPQSKTHHTQAVLALLEQITGEPFFGKLKTQYEENEEVDMCEIFEGFREQYRAQGIAIGEERGIAIGEERGKREGKREQSQDIALKLIDMHMSQEDIAHATGLSLQEVRDLVKGGAVSG